MMEDYAVFTLNSSRVGENLLEDLDNKILSMNVSNIFNKRSEPAQLVLPIATLTAPAPTPLITIAPRQLSSLLGEISSSADNLVSDLGSKATAVQSGLESEASALADAAASKVESALLAAETSIINTVNKAYRNIIAELELSDFYSVHMMTTCTGEYVFPNGTNATTITNGTILPPPANMTLNQRVDSCEKHNTIDPVQIVRIFYIIAIIFTGIALICGIWATVSFSHKLALLNVLIALPAILLLGLASAAVHGVATGAAHLVNFVGENVGVQGTVGRKFLALTWAATILLLVSIALWTALLFVGEKLPLPGKSRGHKANGEKGLDMSRP